MRNRRHRGAEVVCSGRTTQTRPGPAAELVAPALVARPAPPPPALRR
eukprot:CAMPEP_0204504366 /NCGR_PEP_ID=MMETSP0471-20130131/105336_1 /ASSEMBLY_ACC=CAM_ASM_000602 /TAXON_ID=2969 /ORGANISM="Oxyrrhis marina" /LENGTH=46 /DNA_ID= /DNA_START= /DNA_END= /DNA_ORIENTATION=